MECLYKHEGCQKREPSRGNVWAASTGVYLDLMLLGYQHKKFTSIDRLLSNELNSGTADLDGNIWTGAQDGSISVYYPSSGIWRVISDIRSSGESNRKINYFSIW
jgi:sugar lactone lactonase YvrE